MFIKFILNKPYKHIIRGINQMKSKEKSGITLIALIVTIIVHLVPYDKNKKYSNLVGFSL